MTPEQKTKLDGHQPDCRWETITLKECSYRDTHHYCPHSEHGCTCTKETAFMSPREKIEKEFDERLGTYTNEYGYVHNIPNYDAIKYFIFSTIDSVEKEVRAEYPNPSYSQEEVNRQVIRVLAAKAERIEHLKNNCPDCVNDSIVKGINEVLSIAQDILKS